MHPTDLANHFLQSLVNGDLESAARYVSKGMDIRGANQGRDYIHYAIGMLNFRVIPFLVDHGACVHRRWSNEDTVLHSLARTRVTAASESLAYICGHGVDINSLNAKGHTPLLAAAMDGAIPRELVETMLALGADTKAADAHGLCVKTYLIQSSSTDALQAVEAHETEMEHRRQHGENRARLQTFRFKMSM